MLASQIILDLKIVQSFRWLFSIFHLASSSYSLLFVAESTDVVHVSLCELFFSWFTPLVQVEAYETREKKDSSQPPGWNVDEMLTIIGPKSTFFHLLDEFLIMFAGSFGDSSVLQSLIAF